MLEIKNYYWEKKIKELKDGQKEENKRIKDGMTFIDAKLNDLKLSNSP